MTQPVETQTAVPNSTAEMARPNGGQAQDSGAFVHGLDVWLENFRKYEVTLQEVTKITADNKFKTELATVEQWFSVLSESERTATIYTLLGRSSQDQIRFFITVLQQMIRPEVPKPATAEATEEPPKLKQTTRSLRPPSLNLPEPGSPTTPASETPVTAKESAAFLPNGLTGQNGKAQGETEASDDSSKDSKSAVTGLGLGSLNPFQLNMLANAGLSTEAQVVAVQLVMSGLVQPAGAAAPQGQKQAPSHPSKKSAHPGDNKNWRTPASAKYPASALRSSGLRVSALKSAGLKSAGLQSAGIPSSGLKSGGLDSASSMATPREEDFDPEMLKDIPAWLRSLRLHKYTACFDGLAWQEMVVLDDENLEKKGVAALGARRRLLRTFEHVRKRMGMESPSSATPTTSVIPPPANDVASLNDDPVVPHSAAPTTKLSIDSPVFTPSFQKAPQSAAPAIFSSSSSST